MKTKFLIPVLATIFATAMSFTTAQTNADLNHDYIFRNGQWQMISEVSCKPGSDECKITVNPEGQDYPVYDSQSFGTLKPGTGDSEGVINL